MKIFYRGFDIINGNQAVVNIKELSFNPDENFYRKLKSVLKIKRAKNLPFVRVGRVGDGGYIMIDSFVRGGQPIPSASLTKFLGMRTWRGAATMFLCTT